jgi:hypothetical protein
MREWYMPNGCWKVGEETEFDLIEEVMKMEIQLEVGKMYQARNGDTVVIVATELDLIAEVSATDPVNRPAHYTSHPSGIECIQITEHMLFNLGNAVKYIWRADLKLDALEDLRKASWYINREIAKREKK